MSEASANPNPPPRPRRRPPGLAQTNAAPANVNSVGQILRAAREQRGLSVEQIADMLKIRRIYLQAIEDSDWEELPELVYAQGFVRSYASFLGLDEAGASAQFKREFRGGGRRSPELEMPKPLDDHQLPDWKIIAAVVVALFMVYAIWAVATEPSAPEPIQRVAEVQKTQPPAPVETSAIPAATEQPVQPIAQTPAAETPAATGAPAPTQTGISYGATTPTRVTITAAQDSWVQVRDMDGQVVFSRVMRPGDNFRVPNEGTLSLTTGNLAGLYFTIDGKGMTPSGTPGTVFRNLSLAPDNLSSTLTEINKSAPAPAAAPTSNNAIE